MRRKRKVIPLLLFSIALITSCSVGKETQTTKEKIQVTQMESLPVLRYPRGIPGVDDLGTDGQILFHYNNDSLLVKMENVKEHYGEINTYYGKEKRKLLMVPPHIKSLLGEYRYLNKSVCYIDGINKSDGAGYVNIHGYRLFDNATQATNLTMKEYDTIASMRLLPEFPVDRSNVESISFKYTETDFTDAQNSTFYKIKFKQKGYKLDSSVPQTYEKNTSSSDSLQIGCNIPFPAYVPKGGNYSQIDSLHAESRYWFAQPEWWFSNDEMHNKGENSIYWHDNGSPWFNAVHRYYDEKTNTLYLWDTRLQWFKP